LYDNVPFNFLLDTYTYMPLQLLRHNGGLRAGRQGFNSRQGKEIFLYSKESRQTLGTTKPPIQSSVGGPFPGGKTAVACIRPLTFISYRGQEWQIYISIRPYVFMAWCLITKHRNNFTQQHSTGILHISLCGISGFSRRTCVLNVPEIGGTISG
jgi:hypothetical protein